MAVAKKDLGKEILKLVDLMHEEKKISRDVIFHGIESAIQLAAERHFGVLPPEDDEEPTGPGVLVRIDRATGDITARHGEDEIDPETLGRIAAQSAKQVMIQKIREAESDTVFNDYTARKGELLVGTVQRVDAGTAIVSLGKSEALLPRSEQIAGETHHVGERVKAVVFEVRKNGHRVKIVLSRAHPDFVKALFEEEIPEVEDRTIDIRALAREAGYRSKVAVSSIDMKVDCVGACVGVRGSRIKNVIEELNGERIDIVRWNDSLQVLIPNALQPAEIADVFTYPRLGRAIVLVDEDQLSLAIGRRGQNVRLASKLVGMDLEIMTHDELAEALERAERWFGQLPHANEERVQAMIEEGFLSYNELTFIDAAELMQFIDLPEDQADELLIYAEEYAEHMERSTEEERAALAEQAEAEAQAAAEAEALAAAEAEASGANAEAADVSVLEDGAEVGDVDAAARALAEEMMADTITADAVVEEPTDTIPVVEDDAADEIETPPPEEAGEVEEVGEVPTDETPVAVAEADTPAEIDETAADADEKSAGEGEENPGPSA